MNISNKVLALIGTSAAVVAAIVSIAEYIDTSTDKMRVISVNVAPKISISNTATSNAEGQHSTAVTNTNISTNITQIDNRVIAGKGAIAIGSGAKVIIQRKP